MKKRSGLSLVKKFWSFILSATCLLAIGRWNRGRAIVFCLFFLLHVLPSLSLDSDIGHLQLRSPNHPDYYAARQFRRRKAPSTLLCYLTESGAAYFNRKGEVSRD
ncbi:hypothetical protein Bca4012_032713 [Brassica carinata]